MEFHVAQLVAMPRVQAAVPAPDATWVAVEVARLDASGAKYVTDLWRLPLDGSGAKKLTDGDCKDSSPRFRPDGGLYFLSNRETPLDPEAGEDDRPPQIWLLPAGEGALPEQVTDEPHGVEGFLVAKGADTILAMVPWIEGKVSGDQRAFVRDRTKRGPSAKHYTEMPVRHWDHWLSDVPPRPVSYRAGVRTDLAPSVADGRFREVSYAVAPDGLSVAVAFKRMGADRILDDVVVVQDATNGRELARLEGPRANYEGIAFAPDGTALALVESVRTDVAPPRPTLARWSPSSGEKVHLAADWDRWPHLYDWGADGIIVTADDEGAVPVFRIDPIAGSVTRVTGHGASHQDVCAVAGKVVGIRHGTLQPPEVFSCPIGTDMRPTLHGDVSGVSKEQLAGIARLESFVVDSDGAAVHSLVLLPEGPGPHPTLFWIHGGPIGAWSDMWHWRWNPVVFASLGYAVVLPNPRGSTGYGTAFTAGIWGNVWGAQCYRDLMRVADAVDARQDLGAVAAMGGSFGGYMSNWVGGNTDRFKAIVTHASIFSCSAFHGTTDYPAWWALELGSTPYTDFEAHDRYSPQRFLAEWETPTLVIHGEKDYRCPIGEGLALFEGLQLHGVESEMMVFPDEGHWILKPRNIVTWYETIAAFLGRHLAPARPRR